MQAFRKLNGIVAPLDRVNVDTDQIIPKQFLKRIERTGFGEFLFYDWRLLEDGSLNPEFELNDPALRGASILLSRANFGCGSSREHAPWALLDFGFRCLIAPSFADIFHSNCLKNGILPIRLTEEAIEDLFQKARRHSPYRLTVDLEDCVMHDAGGFSLRFTIDPFRRDCLLQGLDDIGLTLQHEDKIRAYESRTGA
jgi:3-isopropylmalate/(R)-2-methylmalate dehydratase small subunit